MINTLVNNSYWICLLFNEREKFAKRKERKKTMLRTSDASEGKREILINMRHSFFLPFLTIEREVVFLPRSESLVLGFFIDKEKLVQGKKKKQHHYCQFVSGVNSSFFENVIHSPFEMLYNMDRIPPHKNPKNTSPKQIQERSSHHSFRLFLLLFEMLFSFSFEESPMIQEQVPEPNKILSFAKPDDK